MLLGVAALLLACGAPRAAATVYSVVEEIEVVTTTTSTSTTTTTLPGSPSWVSVAMWNAQWEEADPDTTPAADATGNGHVLTDNGSSDTADATNVWQGTRSIVRTSGTRLCSGGCDESDFFFTSGSFTCGAAIRPDATTTGAEFGVIMGTDDIPTTQFGAGWTLQRGMNDGEANWQKIEFLMDRAGSTTGFTTLTSTTTTAASTWAAVAIRYDASSNLMEILINGIEETTTATFETLTAGNSFEVGQSGNTFLGNVDDSWCFPAALGTDDIRRIQACNLDGTACVCDWGGDPTDYDDTGHHTDDGGPVDGALPACNKAAPSGL